MPRPPVGLAGAAAALAEAIDRGWPEWITDDTRQAVTLALWHLRRDARRALAAGTVAGAAALGVHRDTPRVWQRDGWLAQGDGE